MVPQPIPTSRFESVSVVIPSLNRKERLIRLLEALSQQSTDFGFEVLVSNDGSTDGTGEAAREFSTSAYHLKVIDHPSPSGAGPARNRAWRLASGDVVVFIDDDCVPETDWLSRIVVTAQGADVAVGATKPAPNQMHLRGPFSSYMEVRDKVCYPTCNIAYRRTVLERLQGFDEAVFQRHNGEDTDLGMRAEKAGFSTVFAPDAVVYHDVRESEFVPYMKRVADREALVALVARHPEARYRLSEGWWLRTTDKALPLVFGALLWKIVRPQSRLSSAGLLTSLLFYLWQWRHAYFRPRSLREFAAAIPLGFVADSWSLAVMARASVRYRTVFL